MPDENAHINIVIRGSDGTERFFKIKPSTAFGKLKRGYAKLQNLDIGSLRLHYDGVPLSDHATPLDLDMIDGDVIENYIPQVGGGGSACFGRPGSLPSTAERYIISWFP
ncbi:ubiquitin-like protein [Cutaneotrichosporon oleaginosum]|uniref:Ubiquitin-like protein n=1 Tax=Cutaneotrichosporon oleaginosum TaxID=879819 RepID=A0A0J0XJG1_9TREE|nr:ubiquitin-like protein [Cutaneotrichosporon oleaginosum]KLT41191.1 ubiquitin-like protein [Cutaneotrichosporon oleaginosum]TXT14092.1 hypothetical protein COLE_00285 [Cutaneotrichosporon oleaginosum]